MTGGPGGQRGELAVTARLLRGRTRLTDLRCRPPLQALRAHHLDPAVPDMAFLIVACTGGGVLQGDRLALRVDVGDGARLRLDTASATRLYRMPRAEACSEVHLRVGRGACLEVVPDPYLPYAGSRFRQQTRVEVAETGVLILAEVVAAGRSAGGEELRYEWFESGLDVRRPSGELLYRDWCRLAPGEGLDAPGLLGRGGPVVGTLHVVAAGLRSDVLAAAVEAARPEGAYWGASELPNGAGSWLRVLAGDVPAAVAAVRTGWRAARVALLGAPPPASRRY